MHCKQAPTSLRSAALLPMIVPITADGALELSSDGSWGRFCSAFSPSFRRTEFYRQFMKDLDSVPINAKVHDVRGVLDTTD